MGMSHTYTHSLSLSLSHTHTLTAYTIQGLCMDTNEQDQCRIHHLPYTITSTDLDGVDQPGLMAVDVPKQGFHIFRILSICDQHVTYAGHC